MIAAGDIDLSFPSVVTLTSLIFAAFYRRADGYIMRVVDIHRNLGVRWRGSCFRRRWTAIPI